MSQRTLGDAKAQERIDELTWYQKPTLEMQQAMQGLADALKNLRTHYAVQGLEDRSETLRILLQIADGALLAAKPFLEEK
jgi:hypothetical protein